ncbi:DivIVA domain-containing protein [Pengzhenrongella sicca]|uniref:DivIVA domain-containing protein n=1 Tax=Pengzhenrongella sicca TaxID=2819238 RepID=A0A8A4ZGI2_9MICO|nr:DivIVA domain-containing protein [Pengzhenrongella sicca]
MRIRFWNPPADGPLHVLDGAGVRGAASALTRTTFREGYEIAAVDAFLERAGIAVDAHRRAAPSSLTADDVRAVRFRATKFREGYDQDMVDDLLDQVAASLRA